MLVLFLLIILEMRSLLALECATCVFAFKKLSDWGNAVLLNFKVYYYQDLNFVGVLLSCRNLAVITRDSFQPLKGYC